MIDPNILFVWDMEPNDPTSLTFRAEDKQRYERMMHLVKETCHELIGIEAEATIEGHLGTAKTAAKFSDILNREFEKYFKNHPLD